MGVRLSRDRRAVVAVPAVVAAAVGGIGGGHLMAEVQQAIVPGEPRPDMKEAGGLGLGHPLAPVRQAAPVVATEGHRDLGAEADLRHGAGAQLPRRLRPPQPQQRQQWQQWRQRGQQRCLTSAAIGVVVVVGAGAAVVVGAGAVIGTMALIPLLLLPLVLLPAAPAAVRAAAARWVP